LESFLGGIGDRKRDMALVRLAGWDMNEMNLLLLSLLGFIS
jgi:hypothetical protein